MKYFFAGLIFIALSIVNYSLYANEAYYTVKTIGQHDDEVLGVFVNWNNTMFASCSVDETVKLWSLPDGKLIRTLVGHLGEVNNVSFSGNDKWLATGSTDHTVKIWDVATGKELKTLFGHTDQVIGVYFSQDAASTFVASTSFDKTVKLWDVSLGKEIKTLRGHNATINNVAYSYDGQTIASCSDDKTIKIWSTDLTSKEPIQTLTGHDSPVLTCVYSFDSKKLVSSDQSGNVFIWAMPEGKIIRKISAHSELVQDVSFAEDNVTIVTGSLDKTVKLWNSDTGENLMVYFLGSEVWTVDLISSAEVITVGCADGTVRLITKVDPSKLPTDNKQKKDTKKKK